MPPNLISGTPELPADVILTILEELHQRQSISHLRVVSKRFDAIVTPLSYRHVHLTDRIIAPFALKQELYDPSIVQLQVARDVQNHARHLTVKRNMDWSLVAKLIRSLVNLRSFTYVNPYRQSSRANRFESSWAFWGPEATNVHESANITIGTALCNTWPNVQLHLEGICASIYQPSHYRNFPNSNLISCKFARSQKYELPIIRELLFERPSLQELHLVDGRSPWSGWTRPTNEVQKDSIFKHLPALKVLIIDGNDWDHSTWENANLWNWSNITHLELRNVIVDMFLHYVPPQCLSGLKVFIAQPSLDDYRIHSTPSLCSLMKNTTVLQKLEIRCETQKSEIVSLIARNGMHIRTLSLLSFDRYFGSCWTPLTFDQLMAICSNCPQLMEMKVDLALPTVPHMLCSSSPSTSTIIRTPTSIIVTRSMSKMENAKLKASDTFQNPSRNERPREEETKKELPSWYLGAYRREKYRDPSYIPPERQADQLRTAREVGKDLAQVEDDYLAWKRNHRKEEVAAALKKSQIYVDPTAALAGSHNLRRLTIFARISHFVPPEETSATFNRTRYTVQQWLDGLLSRKAGADFEKVVFHVQSEAMHEEIDIQLRQHFTTHTYEGKRSRNGQAKIREDKNPFLIRREGYRDELLV